MMNTTQRLLVVGAVSALMLIATQHPAQAQGFRATRLTINEVGGDVRIQQGLPCRNVLDMTTSIMQGRMEMNWLQTGRDGTVLIDLTRLNLFVKPFHVDGSCNGIKAAVDFREIGISLASAVRFNARPTAAGAGLVGFTIPKGDFLIHESVLDTAPVRQPETSYQRPAEDVTGVIDLRRQTVELHVVLTSELHFRAGCDRSGRCSIDETHTGTTTAEVKGRYVAPAPPRR
jgi:hypothetical protein